MDTATPQWAKNIAHDGFFESSTQNTPTSLACIKDAKKWFKEFVDSIGGKDLTFSIGHFEFSGFFTDKDGKIWYFSSCDMRGNIMKSMLVRTAKSYKDYTGGMNRWVGYGADFHSTLMRMIGG